MIEKKGGNELEQKLGLNIMGLKRTLLLFLLFLFYAIFPDDSVNFKIFSNSTII